jgi:hypothetical protein
VRSWECRVLSERAEDAPFPNSALTTLNSPLKDRDAKAELNRRSQACEVLTGTGIRVAENEGLSSEALAKGIERQGIAPCIPVWKTDVYLSTPMLGEWPANRSPRALGKSPPLLCQLRRATFGLAWLGKGWNPVLELHQPLRFCKPPPELLGQRDEIKRGRKPRLRPRVRTWSVISAAVFAAVTGSPLWLVPSQR